jgi:hypothetical protein
MRLIRHVENGVPITTPMIQSNLDAKLKSIIHCMEPLLSQIFISLNISKPVHDLDKIASSLELLSTTHSLQNQTDKDEKDSLQSSEGRKEFCLLHRMNLDDLGSLYYSATFSLNLCFKYFILNNANSKYSDSEQSSIKSKEEEYIQSVINNCFKFIILSDRVDSGHTACIDSSILQNLGTHAKILLSRLFEWPENWKYQSLSIKYMHYYNSVQKMEVNESNINSSIFISTVKVLFQRSQDALTKYKNNQREILSRTRSATAMISNLNENKSTIIKSINVKRNDISFFLQEGIYEGFKKDLNLHVFRYITASFELPDLFRSFLYQLLTNYFKFTRRAY